jgi:uncharacterized alkaline shock family protein YloU
VTEPLQSPHSPQISVEVIAQYAGDAAKQVDGVSGLADGPLHRGKAVEITGDADTLAVGLNLELAWGRSAAEVAGEVQRRVSEYLARMAQVTPASVDVAFDAVSAPPPKR